MRVRRLRTLDRYEVRASSLPRTIQRLHEGALYTAKVTKLTDEGTLVEINVRGQKSPGIFVGKLDFSIGQNVGVTIGNWSERYEAYTLKLAPENPSQATRSKEPGTQSPRIIEKLAAPTPPEVFPSKSSVYGQIYTAKREETKDGDHRWFLEYKGKRIMMLSTCSLSVFVCEENCNKTNVIVIGEKNDGSPIVVPLSFFKEVAPKLLEMVDGKETLSLSYIADESNMINGEFRIKVNAHLEIGSLFVTVNAYIVSSDKNTFWAKVDKIDQDQAFIISTRGQRPTTVQELAIYLADNYFIAEPKE